MANQRLPMHLLRQILLLKHQGKSIRDIARSLAIARNTVRSYLRLLPQTDLTGLLTQTDAQLDQLIQPPVAAPTLKGRLAELQNRLPGIDRQLAGTGVTRYDLWLAYRQQQPTGYQHTQFCHHYRQWHQAQQLTMHLEHKAGDKMFVHFAGKRLALVDPVSGESKPVEFFVAVLGCSQLTYAQAVASQRTEDFIDALQNALRYFGGVPAAIVPDNLKAAVIRPDRYEPQLNETLSDFALHYQTTILPARSGKPRDKALVEGAVNILYNRVYAPLRNQVFHGLAELNTAILARVDAHNQMLFSGKDYSRSARFEAYEQAHLRPLPTSSYQIKHHLVARVQKNCHVLLAEDKHYYSVPHRFSGKQVRLIYTPSTVEIYAHYERIALHPRDRNKYHYSTINEHLPSTQQWVSEWNPAAFLRRAERVGPQTQRAVEVILNRPTHPEQAYKSCQGILSLENKVGLDRLERACERALGYQSVSYKVIRSILERGLDKLAESTPTLPTTPLHENIRGSAAYQ